MHILLVRLDIYQQKCVVLAETINCERNTVGHG
jgi:hypothetical protein